MGKWTFFSDFFFFLFSTWYSSFWLTWSGAPRSFWCSTSSGSTFIDSVWSVLITADGTSGYLSYWRLSHSFWQTRTAILFWLLSSLLELLLTVFLFVYLLASVSEIFKPAHLRPTITSKSLCSDIWTSTKALDLHVYDFMHCAVIPWLPDAWLH